MKTEAEIREKLDRLIKELEETKKYGDLSMQLPLRVSIDKLRWVLED